MALCDQSDVENVLQTSGLTAGVVTQLIEGAQVFIEGHIGTPIESATYTSEKHDGTGRRHLWLDHWPIVTVTSVTEDGDALVADTDFYVYARWGRLTRISAEYPTRWTTKPQAVVVTYDAGYATVPDDLRDVCARMVAAGYQAGAAYAETGSKGAAAEQVDDYRVEWSEVRLSIARQALLGDVDYQTLDHYRHPAGIAA